MCGVSVQQQSEKPKAIRFVFTAFPEGQSDLTPLLIALEMSVGCTCLLHLTCLSSSTIEIFGAFVCCCCGLVVFFLTSVPCYFKQSRHCLLSVS